MKKKLFEIALRYIAKGYSKEDLRWGDDLYDSEWKDIRECLAYYDEIKENGTAWAHLELKNWDNT